jgi:hypothetical protein
MAAGIAASIWRPVRRLALVLTLLGAAAAVGGVLGGTTAQAQLPDFPTDPGDGGGEAGK